MWLKPPFTVFSTGTEWKAASTDNSSATSNWNLAGNTGKDLAIIFVGTSGTKYLVIKTKSTEKLRVLSGVNMSIGLTALFVLPLWHKFE